MDRTRGVVDVLRSRRRGLGSGFRSCARLWPGRAAVGLLGSLALLVACASPPAGPASSTTASSAQATVPGQAAPGQAAPAVGGTSATAAQPTAPGQAAVAAGQTAPVPAQAAPAAGQTAPLPAQAAAATGQAAPASTSSAGAPAGGAGSVVRVGLVTGTGATPIFVAQGRDYFKKQGLDVQFVPVSSGSELLPLLASNQLDAGISSPGAALFNAIGSGVPLKAIADAGRQEQDAYWGALVVRPDLLDSGAIKSPADLKGKTIAVTAPGVGTYLNTISLLEANGLTDADVTLTYLNFGDMISALASKKIDAADMVEPAITLGEAQGVLKRWVSNAEISPGQEESVMMVTPQLAGNQDVAERFTRAYVQGVRDYRAAFGPEKTDQDGVIQTMLPLLPSSFSADLVRRVSPLTLDPDGLVNGDSLKHQQDWYMAHGFVKTPVNVDNVVENRFAEQAREVLSKP